MTAAALRSSGFILSKTSFQNSHKTTSDGRALFKKCLVPVSPSVKQNHIQRLKRLRRTLLNTGNLLSARPDASYFYWAMVTLTYAPQFEWSPKHISGYMKTVRKYLKDNHKITKVHYMWVMELQKRGAPHYHVLIRLRHGVKIPKPDMTGMWFLGMTKVEKARHAVGYLAKYTSKGTTLEQIHQIPKGARLHGASILDDIEMHLRRWWNLPVWVRDNVPSGVQSIRRITGGFCLTKTGQFMPTPYQVEYVGGLLQVTLNQQIIEEYGYEFTH